jgi:hypothetical protein
VVVSVALAYVLTHHAGVARTTPAPLPPAPLPPAAPPSLAPEPADRALEGARADLATGRTALAQGRFDAALAALETARRALMDPAPAAGSPRATTLAEVYLASGDVYRARAPTRVEPKAPGAGPTEFFECANAVRDDQYAALAAYNAVMLDPRFGDQGECAPAHVGALYDMLVATCGTNLDARRQYLGNAVLYYRMADRPGPCARDAAAGLARALAMQHDLGP